MKDKLKKYLDSKNIKKAYEEGNTKDTQIVIYGKIGHAEVNGLVGQTDGSAVVIEEFKDSGKIIKIRAEINEK